jgi:hypothetical protein
MCSSSVSSASSGLSCPASPGSSPGSPRLSWNCSVKVLGYYLSDEERQLKRQWSAENHERMVQAKKQLRRGRLGLADEPCAAVEACVKPSAVAPAAAALAAMPSGVSGKPRLTTGSWLLQHACEPSVKAKTSPPPGSNGRVLFSASTELEPAAPGQERASRAVPFVARLDENAGELSKACADECDRLTLECENVTGRAVQLLSSISATVLAKVHQVLSWTIEKDDAAALTALRNLLVPPLE